MMPSEDKLQEAHTALTAALAEMSAERRGRIDALSSTAIWMDLEFPKTAPHVISCYQQYPRETERHLAEIDLLILGELEPDEETKKARTNTAIRLLGVLGYEVADSGGSRLPFRDEGHTNCFHSNHERISALKTLNENLLKQDHGEQ